MGTGPRQPAQPARQRFEPREEPRTERGNPSYELGLEGHVVRSFSHRRTSDPDPFPARGRPFRRPRLAHGNALLQPFLRPRSRVRFAPRRRCLKHERCAASVAGEANIQALAQRDPVRRSDGVRRGSRCRGGCGLRYLHATPRAWRGFRPGLHVRNPLTTLQGLPALRVGWLATPFVVRD